MEKTLIILGAGASKDFCRIFPTGLELIKDINYHFLTEKKYPDAQESDGVYLSALMNDISRTFGNSFELFRKIKNQLWKIQLHYEWEYLRNKTDNPISIDSFIATKIKNNELDKKAAEIIKYSIYYLIKGTEEAFQEGDYDFEKTWVYKLAKKIGGLDFETINENLNIVTFNYDRVFEEYFSKSLNNMLTLTSNQVDLLQQKVVHVYDSLGTLTDIPFKTKNENVDIVKKHFNRIKLIDERNPICFKLDNPDKFKRVHFIGFGYDSTNLGLINLNQFTSASFQGTAYHFTPMQLENLKLKYNITGIDASCSDYITNMTI